MAILPLSDIVNVQVVISPISTVINNFSLGLIVGKSLHIDTTTRVKVYSNLAGMTADGFISSDAEYLAAQLYFAQNPAPTQIAIGRWDGTGSETAVQAVTICRAANLNWYGVMVCGASKAEIISLATYIESCTPSSVLFYTTSDSDVLTATANNVMDTLRDSSIRRTLGQFSSVAYAVASIMGYAMASSNGQSSTLKFKDEPNVAVEPVTSTQVTNILSQNGNVYIARGNSIKTFENGRMADGTPFDEVLGLDRLTNSLQTNAINALKINPKIPQTEEGITLLLNSLTPSLEAERKRSFLAPGVWNAVAILNLNTGDMMNSGYVIQAGLISDQTQSDRDNRIAPNIYICIKLAGAIEKVALISVNVNR
jgi:hypothetical protein